jgi:GT2 family glycosyltransferase
MRKNNIFYKLDSCTSLNGRYICTGWFFTTTGKVDILNTNEFVSIEKIERPDVARFYTDELGDIPEDCGFKITFKDGIVSPVLVLKNNNDTIRLDMLKLEKSNRRRNKLHKAKTKLKKINLANINKAFHVLKNDGPLTLVHKVENTLLNSSTDVDYESWYKIHAPTQSELSTQRETRFPYMPLISIITPTFNTPKRFLDDMIQSVKAQTYSNWELCLADGSTDESVFEELKSYAANDARIKIVKMEKNEGISGNSNGALKLASGDYIGLFDHDDLLTPDALFEMVKAINSQDKPDLIYSDEDKTDETGKKRFMPHFKPDFSIDFLRASNYICHFTIIKNSLLEKSGRYFDSKYDGAQDYDLVLRCIEKTDKIYHIPKVLYHWRVHANSTAGGASSKPYTHFAGKRAIEDHLKRLGIKADVVDVDKSISNLYRVRYDLSIHPKVSIIIPSYDHKEDLEKCLKSISRTNTYDNLEVLVIENNSKDKKTFDYYDEINGKNHVKVLYYPDQFNFAKINNWAVRQSTGEYIVFMNNDIEMITLGWIEEMLSYAQRKEVGMVGAKLYYPDNTIQHAGVIIGLGGVAGHAFTKYPRNAYGYFSRAIVAQDLSAVTAALMMIRRDVFNEVNHFDELFAVAFNDVDLCMKVRQKKYLIVFDPFVEAYHYESKSRGYEDTPEKKKRFEGEINRFYMKWGPHVIDPYYNKNLSLDLAKGDFTLR